MNWKHSLIADVKRIALVRLLKFCLVDLGTLHKDFMYFSEGHKINLSVSTNDNSDLNLHILSNFLQDMSISAHGSNIP